ncbi:MAG: hypothetical protein CVU57_03025 [Deltaproteobacteria bacterium HGW-Deltaproteobacteria-15]|nr:MAG: hypothetical protein CVU57_03025 [Deltaproteobacteria bacterium HGW-Deltaproteobacteria-15]
MKTDWFKEHEERLAQYAREGKWGRYILHILRPIALFLLVVILFLAAGAAAKHLSGWFVIPAIFLIVIGKVVIRKRKQR